MSSCLLNSINKQNYKNYELILIDNSNNKFPSASKALNFAAKRAKGDYLLFIHQDVDLIESNSLEKISFYLKHLNKWGYKEVTHIYIIIPVNNQIHSYIVLSHIVVYTIDIVIAYSFFRSLKLQALQQRYT